MRLTKAVIEQILNQNEGFHDSTYFKDRNRREENFYSIEDGKLYIRRVGKTSWADSHYDKTFEADLDQTRRFIKSFVNLLNTDGIE